MTFGCFKLVNFYNKLKNIVPPVYTSLHCTLHLSVHFSIRSHTRPSPDYIAFIPVPHQQSLNTVTIIFPAAQSTTPQHHYRNSSKYSYLNTHEWRMQNILQRAKCHRQQNSHFLKLIARCSLCSILSCKIY